MHLAVVGDSQELEAAASVVDQGERRAQYDLFHATEPHDVHRQTRGHAANCRCELRTPHKAL
jgi:hypothetical protein